MSKRPRVEPFSKLIKRAPGGKDLHLLDEYQEFRFVETECLISDIAPALKNHGYYTLDADRGQQVIDFLEEHLLVLNASGGRPPKSDKDKAVEVDAAAFCKAEVKRLKKDEGMSADAAWLATTRSMHRRYPTLDKNTSAKTIVDRVRRRAKIGEN